MVFKQVKKNFPRITMTKITYKIIKDIKVPIKGPQRSEEYKTWLFGTLWLQKKLKNQMGHEVGDFLLKIKWYTRWAGPGTVSVAVASPFSGLLPSD